MEMLQTPIGRLRFIGLVEGGSYLLLLGIAMPLKYLANIPLAVTIVGQLHGILFVAFAIVLLDVYRKKGLDLKWSVLVFVAAVLPFGPFVIDGRLKKIEEERLHRIT